MTDRDWMHALADHLDRSRRSYPDDELAVVFDIDGTIVDSRHLVVHALLGWRDKGSIAYGAGLFSPSVTFESFGTRFHGNDERIDVESLGLAADFWLDIARDLLT
jgi:phosphoglycolate phosphatase-like HAD superfamily hydrolase